MVNDLLFPILPRDTRAPVQFRNRVQKIGKITRIEALGEHERMEHDEERRVSSEEERKQYQQNRHEHDDLYGRDGHMAEEHEAKENNAPLKEELEHQDAEPDAENEDKIKHLDIYI